MTTPARNIDTHVYRPARYLYRDCFGSPFYVVGTATVDNHRLIDQRPASVTNPKEHRHWRNPMVYYRYYKNFNPQPEGDITVEVSYPTYCSNPGATAAEIYEGGIGWSPLGSDLPSTPDYLWHSAITQAYLKLKDQKVNLGVAYAERKETARLFEDNAKSIAKQVRSFKQKHGPKVWNSVKQEGTFFLVNGRKVFHKVPDRWLELQYGWKPLMSDIIGSCNALNKSIDADERVIIRVHGKAAESYTKKWVKTTDFMPYVYQDVEDKIDHYVKVMMAYHQRNPLLASLSGLGLTNPAEIIWERIPYSFVVDWFLPVGNWLSAFDADLGFDFKIGAYMEQTKVRGEGQLRVINPTPNMVWTSSSAPYKFFGFNFGRAVMLYPPCQGFPHFKNPISAFHISNAMSLLIGAFR